MKVEVKERSPQRLRLVLRTAASIYLFVGWGFIALGFWALLSLADRVELRVSEGEVAYERKFLGIFSRNEFQAPVGEVLSIGIVLEIGFGRSYEIVIESADGSAARVSLPMSDGDAKHRIAAAAMEALDAAREGAGAAEGFRHRENGIALGVLFWAVSFGGGLACLYFIQTVTVVADRERGRLRILRRRHFSLAGQRAELDLSEVVSARRFGKDSSYQVYFDLEEDSVPVAIGPMFTKKSADETVKILRGWLKGRV